MLIDRLEVRDLEVLRTLARLRYVSTRQFVEQFFPSTRVARRRLERLSSFDLIRPHTKGVPELLRYAAWRLTGLGVECVREAFPEERLPPTFAERLAEGSLGAVDHRDAISRLYFQVVVGPDRPVSDADIAGARAAAQRVRARASQLQWRPDGELALRYRTLAGGTEQVIPDATVTAAARRIRIFLELDRSTHGQRRVRESLGRYQQFLGRTYAEVFHDQLPACVALVTMSAARRDQLRPAAESMLRRQAVVLTQAEAPGWIQQHALAEAWAPSASPAEATVVSTLRGAAVEVYRSSREHQKELRARGTDLPEALRVALAALHGALQKSPEEHHGR